MLAPLLGRGNLAIRRSRKRRVEMVFSQLELRRRRQEHRCSFRCSRNSRRVVAGVNARLQLANPIPRRGKGQLGFALEALLKAALVELGAIEGSKDRPLSAEHTDEPELPGHAVVDESERHLPYEFESILGLPVGLTERISGRQKIRDQVDAAIGYIRKITGFLRRLESLPQQAAAHRQVLRPVDDVDGKNEVDTRSEPVKSALFDQIEAEPAKAEPCLVVSEVHSKDAAQPRIGEA